MHRIIFTTSYFHSALFVWAFSPQGDSSQDVKDPECEIVWEKTPTPEEESKAKSLYLPPTFLCGLGTDVDTEKDKPDDFETEVRKVQEALVSICQECTY